MSFSLTRGYRRRRSQRRRGSQRRRDLRVESLEPRRVLGAGPLEISEIMAINFRTHVAENENYRDWIEIHNPTDETVSLKDWYLTDDDAEPRKWQFPDISLEADGYLVVFASDRNQSLPGHELHTNFKLDGDGEYLALVHPDGETISHEYAPEFPKQFADVSYGLAEGATLLTSEGTRTTYRVPTPDDASLQAGWVAPDFDDSQWSLAGWESPILITEVSTGEGDSVEIQNVSGATINTAGWVVALNDAREQGGVSDIHARHTTLWRLPDVIGVDDVLYRTDDVEDIEDDPLYFGENINWEDDGSGWVLIVDDAGHVVDFVVWGYTGDQLAAFSVDVNGFVVTAEDAWTEAPITPDGNPESFLLRTGGEDSDNAGDWAVAREGSIGRKNAGLSVPFYSDPAGGIGFSVDSPGLGDAVETDLQDEMHGINASLWTRTSFDVYHASRLDSLALRVRYNDGFVAYLNGHEIARRNAPASLEWDSTANSARSVEDSLAVETIDVSDSLGLLEVGTNVLAVQGLNVEAADDDFLIAVEVYATGERYFTFATPGEANPTGPVRFVGDTQFSRDRGIYEGPFQVRITTDTPQAVIRYTTDGSLPTETHGVEYAAPLLIARTTTLRAAAFKEGYIPTNVDTQTYIFVEDVIQQAANPPGFPGNWNGVPADYEMDPNVVANPEYRQRIRDALLWWEIPALSIVLPPEDLFGSEGIYANPLDTSLEKVASVEWFRGWPVEFQIDAGVSIQGGESRNPGAAAKHSLSLRFRDVYGAGRLDEYLFDGPVNRFNSLYLSAGYTDSWIHSDSSYRQTAQLIRDQWMRDSLTDMGQLDAGQGRFVNVFLNGLYWGVYNLQERQEASHYAQYNGGNEDDLDALKGARAVDGDMAAFHRMQATVARQDWEAIQEVLDVDNYIDWLIIQQFAGNRGLAPDNWRAAGGGPGDAPWRFYSSNAETVLRGVFDDVRVPDPWGLLFPLQLIPEFQMRFADRLHKHLFNNGALTPERNIARWTQQAGQLDSAIVAESARWGDNRREPAYTRDAEWLAEKNWLVNGYFPVRTQVVVQQYQSQGLYPAFEAPVFHVNGEYKHGGRISANDWLTMTAGSDRIYYTLDGSDPRLPDESISPTAIAFVDWQLGIPPTAFTIEHPSMLKARALAGGEWSALTEAPFSFSSVANLTVSELNYHPYDPTPEELAVNPDFRSDDFEFVELYNTGNTPVDLTGVQFTEGIEFDFTDGSSAMLNPRAHVVIVSNLEAFEVRYGMGLPVAGEYEGTLSNGGEQIVLEYWPGWTLAQFNYDDDDMADWPQRPDGKGASLEAVQPYPYGYWPDYWRPSSEYGGSPGWEGTGPIGDVVINEVLTHTDDPLRDAIELHNTTYQPIYVGGWYVSDTWGWSWNPDNGDYKKYRIPDGTTIPPGGYLVLDESNFNPEPDNPGPHDFALNGAHGDDVWLMEADANDQLVRCVDHVDFPAAAQGESLGRWPNASGELYPMTQRTFGSVNSGPRIGPVLISELMYRPGWTDTPQWIDPDEREYVEIYNPTDQAVNLTHWRLRGGIVFDFARDTELAPGEALIVVPFDLNDAQRMANFLSVYIIGDSVQIVGPYSGQLADEGEDVRLESPDHSPEDEPDFIPRVLEDEVYYNDGGLSDGDGFSLHRQLPVQWGNDPSGWPTYWPSPGWISTADAYEPNGGTTEAYYPGFDWSGRPLSSIAGPAAQTDPDWYRIDVPRYREHLVVDLTHPQRNYYARDGLQIVDASGQAFASSDANQGDNRIDTVLPWPGTWYLQVLGNNYGAVYDLQWQTQFVYHPGDANLDGTTDVRDFNIWNAHKFTAGTIWEQGDFNGDGRTDVRDFNIWNANKFTSAPVPAPVDAALQQESENLEALIGELAWLSEYQQASSGERSSGNATRAEAAVDRLLSTYWK